MSNVISFLESVGQNAALRGADKEQLEFALSSANIEPALQAAILGNDQSKLEELLGCRTNVCCGIFPGKEDEDEKEPSKDDDEVRSRSTRAA